MSILVGIAVGGGTYLWAKHRRRASTSNSAIAGVATGAASAATAAVVVSVLPTVLLIGIPLGIGYLIAKDRGQPKALKPGNE